MNYVVERTNKKLLNSNKYELDMSDFLFVYFSGRPLTSDSVMMWVIVGTLPDMIFGYSLKDEWQLRTDDVIHDLSVSM